MTQEEYYEQHAICPECGGCDMETTTLGKVVIGDITPDRNRAHCMCGWFGIIHDLVPAKSSKISAE